MVFGFFIDVPLLTAAFIITLIYRKKLAFAIKKTKLPIVVLYSIVAILLLIFEEQIDCLPTWCGKVIIPPTIPFLFIQYFRTVA